VKIKIAKLPLRKGTTGQALFLFPLGHVTADWSVARHGPRVTLQHPGGGAC